MGFSEKTVARLNELLQEIQGRKAYDNAAATYKDVGALKEMVSIVDAQLEPDGDSSEETLADSITVLQFVAAAKRVPCGIRYCVEISCTLESALSL